MMMMMIIIMMGRLFCKTNLMHLKHSSAWQTRHSSVTCGCVQMVIPV